MQAPSAERTTRLKVELAEEISKHRVPNSVLRQWPLSTFIDFGLGYLQDPAGDSNGAPICGNHFDRQIPSFRIAKSFSKLMGPSGSGVRRWGSVLMQ